MAVIGWLFIAGSIGQGLLLFASIGFGWVWGPYRPGPGAFIVLVVVGAASIAATAGLGVVMLRGHQRQPGAGEPPAATGPPVIEARAAMAVIAGIAAIVLVWPFGVLLGPASFWLGTSAVRRINQDPGKLTGRGRAQTGTIIGALVSGMYLFWILGDVAAIFFFGSPIPAAP